MDTAPTDTFPSPPERDFYKLARELIPGAGDISPVVSEEAKVLEVGHRKTLNLVDIEATVLYQSDFVLQLVTPNAYWLVEDGLDVDQVALERSASRVRGVDLSKGYRGRTVRNGNPGWTATRTCTC